MQSYPGMITRSCHSNLGYYERQTQPGDCVFTMSALRGRPNMVAFKIIATSLWCGHGMLYYRRTARDRRTSRTSNARYCTVSK
jgi:hypothetical protein